MPSADATLRSGSFGGTRPHAAARSAPARAMGAAIAMGVVIAALIGCAQRSPRDAAAARTIAHEIQAGHGLYQSGEYALAATRFQMAADTAGACNDRDTERRARVAECTSWLRARAIESFAACTDQLEGLQRRARYSDPGVNTLLALGAIAGGRPLPGLRLPRAVRPVVRDTAEESH